MSRRSILIGNYPVVFIKETRQRTGVMTYRKQLLITTAALALAPFVAQAANTTWNGTNSSVWETAGNWSAGVPTGNGFTITITNGKNSPIQVTANETYNTTGTGATT